MPTLGDNFGHFIFKQEVAVTVGLGNLEQVEKQVGVHPSSRQSAERIRVRLTGDYHRILSRQLESEEDVQAGIRDLINLSRSLAHALQLLLAPHPELFPTP
jgi:hypothetical protein